MRQASLSEITSDSETMVALCIGQSNAGNHLEQPYTPHNITVFNYYNGKLYHASDPLLGATGYGGSVWGLLSDMLIDSSLFDKVIIVPAAVGSSSSFCWAHGECALKLKKILQDLSDRKIKLTHIFWHQGAADNAANTTSAMYVANLTKMLSVIRSYNIKAPLYVCVDSYNDNVLTKSPFGIDTTIENAQKAFVAANTNVLSGPNTDSLNHAIERFDGIHFSALGTYRFAKLWLYAIKAKSEY